VNPEDDQAVFRIFEIDMDLKPKDRFKEVATHYREAIIEAFDETIQLIPDVVVDLFEVTSWWWNVIHHERYQEIKGIVEAVDDPKITVAKTVLINYLYELGAWCTSIVAKQANGTIVHSRNLDFPQTSQMRAITFNARFKKGGKFLYNSIMFAGNVGIYTGLKPGAFSVSQNTRAPNDHYIGLIENLIMFFTG